MSISQRRTTWDREPAPREPRRQVVDQVDMLTRYGNDIETLLSCGHVMYVRRYSRYHGAKTMGCRQCYVAGLNEATE